MPDAPKLRLEPPPTADAASEFERRLAALSDAQFERFYFELDKIVATGLLPKERIAILNHEWDVYLFSLTGGAYAIVTAVPVDINRSAGFLIWIGDHEPLAGRACAITAAALGVQVRSVS